MSDIRGVFAREFQQCLCFGDSDQVFDVLVPLKLFSLAGGKTTGAIQFQQLRNALMKTSEARKSTISRGLVELARNSRMALVSSKMTALASNC